MYNFLHLYVNHEHKILKLDFFLFFLDNNIGDQGCQSLSEGLQHVPNLTRLDLDGNLIFFVSYFIIIYVMFVQK